MWKRKINSFPYMSSRSSLRQKPDLIFQLCPCRSVKIIFINFPISNLARMLLDTKEYKQPNLPIIISPI